MNREKEKPQRDRKDQKSDRIRVKLGSPRVPLSRPAYLTCNEAQLDLLMSEGETT